MNEVQFDMYRYKIISLIDLFNEHVFVIWNCIRLRGKVSRKQSWFKVMVIVHQH